MSNLFKGSGYRPNGVSGEDTSEKRKKFIRKLGIHGDGSKELKSFNEPKLEKFIKVEHFDVSFGKE